MSNLVKLGDYVEILTGNPFRSSGYTDEVIASIRLLRGDNIGNGKLRWDGVKRWPSDQVDEYKEYRLQAGDVVIAMDRPWIASGLKYAEVRPDDTPSLLVQRVARLRARPGLRQRYLTYLIGSKDFTNYILGVQTGTAVPHISATQIKNFSFKLPSFEVQESIADLLGALDDKIAVNDRVTSTARNLQKSLYILSIQDQRIWSTVGESAEFHNKSRVPLSSRQRKEFQGSYPYYGANGILDHVAEYKFNGSYILVGEDGTVITNDGHPVTRHAFGKFWVSNHAHVLRGHGISNELLHCALQFADVRPYVTGAVQPKLNMGNLKKLTISLPLRHRQPALEMQLSTLEHLILRRSDESQTLVDLRDMLLPRLMSGEIKVRDAERIVEDAV